MNCLEHLGPLQRAEHNIFWLNTFSRHDSSRLGLAIGSIAWLCQPVLMNRLIFPRSAKAVFLFQWCTKLWWGLENIFFKLLIYIFLQEEKNRDIRSRYNGRLFLSWLQDVDDKWEKIKVCSKFELLGGVVEGGHPNVGNCHSFPVCFVQMIFSSGLPQLLHCRVQQSSVKLFTQQRNGIGSEKRAICIPSFYG